MRLFTTIAIAIGGAVAAQQGYVRASDLEQSGAVVASSVARAAWERIYRDDPADSLYRLARQTLNDGNNRRAAQLFLEIQRRYPESQYVPDAMYYQAFALSRTGSEKDLKTAREVLAQQLKKYPNASNGSDSKALLAQIQGRLAKGGDPVARQRIGEIATGDSSAAAATDCNDDDNEMRIAALDALLQMDADQAMPILKRVLGKRDDCSSELRRKAVFLVAQHHTSETESILLSVARSDPDSDVRQQAVFWLSEVHSDHAIAALDSILRSSDDEDVQDKAIFALANTGEPRAFQILRTYAASSGNPEELRAKAVFWLGQNGERDAQNITFLRELFEKTTDSEEIQDKIIQAFSNMPGPESDRWLLDVVQNEKLPVETRKKALFWAGQQRRITLSQLLPLYDRMSDEELREHFIFVLSQRPEAAATDKLIEIAKTDKDKEMRKKALFWLAQKNDPRAKQLLIDIINQ